MNSVLVNCFALVMLSTMYLAWILLPLVNLHIINNSEAFLQERVQSLLDRQRLSPANLAHAIKQLDLNNIVILGVETTDLPDYLIYRVNYKYKWIFSNKFLSADQVSNMVKSKTYILDRV